MSFPPAPPLGSLRLATVLDVPKIAAVATAGFYYSPVFPWERRFHAQYLHDTLQSYEKMFADIIADPQYIAVVARDVYDADENSKTNATIPPESHSHAPTPGSRVIAGVATWKLQPGSKRIGQSTSALQWRTRTRQEHKTRDHAGRSM